MMGILHGAWIVSSSWVDACAAAGSPVAEDSHEVAGDCSGNQQGPILGRLQKNAKLLHGWEVRSLALLRAIASVRYCTGRQCLIFKEIRATLMSWHEVSEL